MKKNELCRRCRELVFDNAQYDYNPMNINADLYKKVRQLENRMKELSHIIEREAAKELIRNDV